jgi:hypothetical protein
MLQLGADEAWLRGVVGDGVREIDVKIEVQSRLGVSGGYKSVVGRAFVSVTENKGYEGVED